MAPRVILWHRTDLRLHDAPALQAALDLEPEAFFPTWTWNPHYVHRQAVGVNRWQFLLDSMNAMSESYTSINPRQKLHVVRGPPETVLPMLFKQWEISHLVFEYDPDPYACDRDEEITKLAESAGVEVIVKHGFTLYEPAKLIELNKGKPPLAYGPFVKLCEKLGDPVKPIDAPTELPDPGEVELDGVDKAEHSVESYRKDDVNHVSRKGDDHGFDTLLGPKGDFSVPTMEELNMEEPTSTIRGGEARALEGLEAFLRDKKAVINFKKPETNPAQFDPPSTTQLSPHLKFGTLSCRTFYWRLREIIDGKSHSDPPMSLIGQLLFREEFKLNRPSRLILAD